MAPFSRSQVLPGPPVAALSAVLLALALVLVLAPPAGAQPPVEEPAAPPPAAAPEETIEPEGATAPPARPPVEVVSARVVPRGEARLYAPARPGHADVVELRVFLRDAGRAAWSAQGDWIAFDRADPEGRRDVFLVRADGSDERCLTCDAFSLHGVSAFDPVWHPSGQWLVFRGQDLPRRRLPGPAFLATPLGGVHTELWAIGADGRDAWQLTHERQHGGVVGSAVFSHEGSRLAWSARVAAAGPVGEWVLRVGEVAWRRGVGRMRDVRTVDPAPRGLHWVSEFTPDDRGLLVTSDAGGLGERDVAVVDLADGSRRPLSVTPGVREEHAVAVPRGETLVWVSDRGLEPPRHLPYRGELWLRSWTDDEPATVPRRAERLTFFNHPDSGYGLGEALVDDIAWSPEGDRLLMHVVRSDDAGTIEEGLWLAVLAADYRR